MEEQYDDEDDLSLGGDSVTSGGAEGRSPLTGMRGLDEENGLLGGGGSRRSTSSSPGAPPRHLHSSSSSHSGESFRSFLLSSCLAELVGTFFLVFIGVSGVYASNLVGGDALSTGSLLTTAISYGFAYGCLVYAFSLNGGGYVPSIRQMNPALTLCLYLLGKVDLVKALFIVVAQIIGAITGTGILFLCFEGRVLRVFELYDGTNIWQQLAMSILVTFIFCFVVIITNFAVSQPVLQQGVSTDSSEQAPQTVHELNCLISSLVAVVGCMVGTPLSGCFMNPLYGLTVLSLSNWLNSAIVVVLGPIFGALLATLVAKLFSYRTRAPFLAGVRWGQGGLGGLGLGNLPPAQQMAALGGSTNPRPNNPFRPHGGMDEEKQGSRF